MGKGEQRAGCQFGFWGIVLAAITAVAIFRVFAPTWGWSQQTSPPQITSVAEADAACAGCHQDIFHSYLNTPMANASGRALDRAIPGSLYQAPSKMIYRIFASDQSLWLSYGRIGNPSSQGRQKLEYFLGSGHLGVTYLYSVQGYLLESPVAFYTNLKAYDMKPGLSASTRVPEALPMSPGCMRCHMSGVQHEDPGTNNHYQGLPFLHGGITCESCHGDTQAHVASRGRARVINPAKLDAERRDSICISCHLEGDTNVEHRGRSVADYKPGERIADYLSYFVYAGANATSRGVSEVEQLNLSKCKRVSGDRMSCMSCHDPHRSPAPEQRASYYRNKCLSCHTQPEIATNHYPEKPDCTSCHMPSGRAENIPHVAWTDHRIRQRPDPPTKPAATPAGSALVSLLTPETSKRDLALAYYNLATGADASETQTAVRLLLEEQKSGPPDAAVLAALGVLAPSVGLTAQAAGYYREALKLDPLNLLAANNLGTLLARSGQMDAAVSLWQTAFDRNQDIESLGVNLALAECRLGQKEKAERVLQQVLVFGPDSPTALRRLRTMQSGQETCQTK